MRALKSIKKSVPSHSGDVGVIGKAENLQPCVISQCICQKMCAVVSFFPQKKHLQTMQLREDGPPPVKVTHPFSERLSILSVFTLFFSGSATVGE